MSTTSQSVRRLYLSSLRDSTVESNDPCSTRAVINLVCVRLNDSDPGVSGFAGDAQFQPLAALCVQDSGCDLFVITINELAQPEL